MLLDQNRVSWLLERYSLVVQIVQYLECDTGGQYVDSGMVGLYTVAIYRNLNIFGIVSKKYASFFLSELEK